jgi:hypothetical protein
LEVLAGMKKKKRKTVLDEKTYQEIRRVEDMPGYVDTLGSRPPRPVFRGRNIQGDVRGDREGR